MHNSDWWILINIAFKESIDLSAIHYSTLQKHVVETFESLLGAKYADWVSRTGASDSYRIFLRYSAIPTPNLYPSDELLLAHRENLLFKEAHWRSIMSRMAQLSFPPLEGNVCI